MKLKKCIKMLNYFIIFTLIISDLVGASMPNTVKIITEKGIICTVQYEDYDLNVERKRIEGSNDIVYCLEIDKKYTSGQTYLIKATEK